MKNLSFCGDCFDIMPQFEVESIDMILADLPYGVTACKWDSVLPFDKLWENYKRLIKKNGAIVLFGTQPFTTDLINSNRKFYRYLWTWNKGTANGFGFAKYQPLRSVEDIVIFSYDKELYNPQMELAEDKNKRPRKNGFYIESNNKDLVFAPSKRGAGENHNENFRFPKNIINIRADEKEVNKLHRIHPTQKPVELLKYLIKTYTNEGMTVLDNTAGSLSTAIACLETNRNYVVIEKENKYFDKGQIRIKQWHENNVNKLKLIL